MSQLSYVISEATYINQLAMFIMLDEEEFLQQEKKPSRPAYIASPISQEKTQLPLI